MMMLKESASRLFERKQFSIGWSQTWKIDMTEIQYTSNQKKIEKKITKKEDEQWMN